MRVSKKGFTLIELLVVITIIGILAAIALPNYIKAKDKAKEVEAKANLHSIQIAVERYNTDHHEYPPYLLGGDSDGWLYWHSEWDDGSPNPDLPSNTWVQDPLVEYNYMVSYPENPFIDAGDGKLIIDSTSFEPDPQQGDGTGKAPIQGQVYQRRADVLPRQLSFKHTLQIWIAWSQRQFLSGAKEDTAALFILIAQIRVGNRPGRLEPRAVKRRPKPYPRLHCHRWKAREDIRKYGHAEKLRA